MAALTNGQGFYRNKFGHVIIQVYDADRKGTKKVPRKECAHLDGASDDIVMQWRAMYLRQRLREAPVAERAGEQRALAPTEEAAFLFKQFMDEHQRLRKTSGPTRKIEEARWRGYIEPYFVGDRRARDVRLWCMFVADFPTWLGNSKLQTNQQKKVINLARRFGEFLTRHRKIPERWWFMLPVDNCSAVTPLSAELTPDDALKFAASAPCRAQLLLLLGYFASLRPEESFALQKRDFLTGDKARSLARTHARFASAGLGSGLSIAITKAHKKDRQISEPKTRSSRAVVNIWNGDAARMIAERLRELPDGWLFPSKNEGRPLGREALFSYWFKYGLKTKADGQEGEALMTMHDLRRASCLYLGRTLDLPVTLLQEHMRHSDIKTTMLYMRRPEVKFAAPEEQNWDDVGA